MSKINKLKTKIKKLMKPIKEFKKTLHNDDCIWGAVVYKKTETSKQGNNSPENV